MPVLEALEEELAPEITDIRERQAKRTNGHQPTPSPVHLDDRALLDKAMNAANGAKFRSLWNREQPDPDGGWNGGDQALANLLLWWCDRRLDQADRMFRSSARMRDKWDEVHDADGRTYGQMTLDNALAETTDGYRSSPVVLSSQPKDEVRKERKLRWRTAVEIATETPPEIHWAAKPWAARGAITEVDAKIKAGKTTWVLAMIRAKLDGLPFMGEPTDAGPAVILSEQSAATLRESLRRGDLLDRSDVHVLYRTECVGLEWAEIVAEAVAKCRDVGANLLLIDTLTQFSGLRGDSENNAGDAMAVMAPLQEAVAPGWLSIISNRHDRKGGGEVGDSARGSSAFGGAVDIIVSMRRPEGNTRPTQRLLECRSRFDETPDRLMVDLRPEGYVSLGDEKAVADKEAREALLNLCPEDEPTEKDLIDRLPEVKPGTLSRVLRQMLDEGLVTRTGKGGRGNAYRYAFGSYQTSTPIGEKQSEVTNDA